MFINLTKVTLAWAAFSGAMGLAQSCPWERLGYMDTLSFVVAPGRTENDLLVTTWGKSGSQIGKSSDGGQTFQWNDSEDWFYRLFPLRSLGLHFSDGKYKSKPGIFHSTDSGSTWQPIKSALPEREKPASDYDKYLLYFSANGVITYSDDGGLTIRKYLDPAFGNADVVLTGAALTPRQGQVWIATKDGYYTAPQPGQAFTRDAQAPPNTLLLGVTGRGEVLARHDDRNQFYVRTTDGRWALFVQKNGWRAPEFLITSFDGARTFGYAYNDFHWQAGVVELLADGRGGFQWSPADSKFLERQPALAGGIENSTTTSFNTARGDTYLSAFSGLFRQRAQCASVR